MDNKIRHDGIIDNIGEGIVKVRILQTSACAACKIASHCRSASPLGSSKNAAESKEKIVDVHTTETGRWTVGQSVTVSASRNVISHAMMLAFALPLLLMVVTLVAVMLWTGDEGTAGLASLAVLVPYFLVVWLFRDRIGRKISFSIDN